MATAHVLVRMFDHGQEGIIRFEEFMFLHSFIMNVKSVFHGFDTNKDGYLSIPEVKSAVAELGTPIGDDPIFKAIMMRFDTKLCGYLQFQQVSKRARRKEHKSHTIHFLSVSIDLIEWF
jgi:Ca2+-binding EF-hand superfamily protein